MGMICLSDFFNFCSDRILETVPDKVKIVDDGLVQHTEEDSTFSRIRNGLNGKGFCQGEFEQWRSLPVTDRFDPRKAGFIMDNCKQVVDVVG